MFKVKRVAGGPLEVVCYPVRRRVWCVYGIKVVGLCVVYICQKENSWVIL